MKAIFLKEKELFCLQSSYSLSKCLIFLFPVHNFFNKGQSAFLWNCRVCLLQNGSSLSIWGSCSDFSLYLCWMFLMCDWASTQLCQFQWYQLFLVINLLIFCFVCDLSVIRNLSQDQTVELGWEDSRIELTWEVHFSLGTWNIHTRISVRNRLTRVPKLVLNDWYFKMLFCLSNIDVQ